MADGAGGTTVSTRSAGAWAIGVATRYDERAAQLEADGNLMGASLNRSEAERYRRVAANMDAAFPGGMPKVLQV